MGISLFIGIPMITLAAYNAYKLEMEHHHHIEEHGRAPFVAYPHLRRRTKVVIYDEFCCAYVYQLPCVACTIT